MTSAPLSRPVPWIRAITTTWSSRSCTSTISILKSTKDSRHMSQNRRTPSGPLCGPGSGTMSGATHSMSSEKPSSA